MIQQNKAQGNHVNLLNINFYNKTTVNSFLLTGLTWRMTDQQYTYNKSGDHINLPDAESPYLCVQILQ